MLTQCPQCQTVFRLSLGQLEAADGRVRCGVCQAVFNALSAVAEEADAARKNEADEDEDEDAEKAEEADEDEQDSPPAARIPVAPPEASNDSLEDTAEHELLDVEIESTPSIEITMEGERIDIDGEELIEDTGEMLAVDTPSGATGTEQALIEEVAVDLASAPLPTSPAAEKASLTPGSEPPAVARAAELPSRQIPAPEPRRGREIILPSGTRVAFDPAPQTDEPLPAVLVPRERPPLTRGWIIGSALAGFLLILQLVHFNRDALARSATLGPMLTGLYGFFGLELSPVWNLQAYELRQWGATADPKAGGALRVRASLFNNGSRAQPYPLLRLTLQDRFGNKLAARDLKPQEYLRGAPTGKFLDAGQRVDAEIAVVDPGKDAVGFEMDVCLRAARERIVCAGDLRR